MASKDTPPLYEFVHRSEKDPKRAMALPAWMNKHREAEAEAERAATPTGQAQPEPEPEPAAMPVVERRPLSERPGDSAVRERGARRIDVAAARAWMQTTVAFRLPRSTLVMLGLGAVVALAIVFLVGQKLGKRSAVGQELDYQKAEAAVAPYREQPVRPLIPDTVAGVERGATGTTDLDGGRIPGPPAHEGASGSADDPREPGLNYYRLVVLPSDADEVNRIIDYLGANGVDAAAIPVNNGRSVKILALKGFSKPLSDPQAQRYEQLLGQLGRKWKAEHRGSSDWKDMLPEKYRPGRT